MVWAIGAGIIVAVLGIIWAINGDRSVERRLDNKAEDWKIDGR